MQLIHRFFEAINRILPAKPVYAHCDIPCGIYDPHLAQMAAHTVIRMNTLIGELQKEHGKDHKDHNHNHMQEHVHKMARYTLVKEEHAELCKKEIRILWGDYFKPEHADKHPELHELVWNVMKQASKARQEINMQAAEDLLETVNKIAEIFWETKGVKTSRVKAPYPTGREIVVPKL
ncbi:MAG: superoxide dismutase, Ni [Candidatus Aenigmarchaeota archaeon]|nr:superoxide dismutase, Ni [Candidatus Aenigmarchaeota archaeon]